MTSPREALLGAVLAHPGAGLLAGAGVGIEVPEADALAVLAHLEDAHVGRGRPAGRALRRTRSRKLAGGPEHPPRDACPAAGTASPRSHRGRTSPCAPSRRSSGSPRARSARPRLRASTIGCISATSSRTRATAGAQTFSISVHRRVRRLGHLVVGDPVGEGREAEQLRLLGAQRQDLGDEWRCCRARRRCRRASPTCGTPSRAGRAGSQ